MASEITAQSAGEKPLSARPPAIGRYTNVNFAPARRGGEAGMLCRDEVEGSLSRLNPRMTADAIRATFEKLEALPPAIEGNREILA